MSYLLFVDESGHDQRESPYEVLAGVTIEDRDLWSLVCEIRAAEERHFGCRYSADGRELKAKRLLKTKVFRQASLFAPIEVEERTRLARECLLDGAGATPRHHAALAQAKLAFVDSVLEVCGRFRCCSFASIVPREAPRSENNFLRKDYAYLFERFFYFLDAGGPETLGLVVFDESERSQSHLLLTQMDRYFVGTATGRRRSGRVIPEPFFVHSHLTTGVQLADLVAYIIAWGVREPGMTEPARPELASYAEAVSSLRRDTRTDRPWQGFICRGFAVINDLRPRDERLLAPDEQLEIGQEDAG